MLSDRLQLVKRLFGVRIRQIRRNAHVRPQVCELETRTLLSFQLPGPFPVGSHPSAVVAADINGDGKPDLVTANNGGHSVSVLLANGDGTFQAARTVAVDSALGLNSVAVVDVNGDGKPDLV